MRIVVCVAVFLLSFLFIWTNPTIRSEGTVKIWDRNNTLLYESAGIVGRKVPIPFEKIPQHFVDAVVVSEDESFWTNPGFDFRAIFRAFISDIRERRIVSGASTITQQLVRSQILHADSRSVIRKIREIFIALRLSHILSKKEIFTEYANNIYFGNLSYGIQAASRTYFGNDANQLSLAQCAFLAGLLSSPDTRNPFTNIKDAKNRQLHILDLMMYSHLISLDSRNAAAREPIVLSSAQGTIKAPHFVSFVLDNLNSLAINKNKGLNVYTTLDYSTFLLSQDIAQSWVTTLSSQHDLTNAALVLLNNQTGGIISMLGGINYFDATHSGQINMAVSARQPGSALKPITYAAAFAGGFTPATVIYDVPKVFKTKKGAGYIPNNYDGKFHGIVLAREALASSLNLPAVEMLNRIGIDTFLEFARRLGISTLEDRQRYDLSLTLGGGEVTLLDLTNVYAAFARGGDYLEPYAIEKVTDDAGTVLFQHKDKSPMQELGANGKQIAYQITSILSDPEARIPGFGEKNPLVLSHPAAVKTGTTTDWHDNWTVGYTPSYTVGVWVGNNDNHAMTEITGVTGAAPIWNQFFEEFLKGKPSEQFNRPDGLRDVIICKLTGMLPDENCDERYTEIFINGTEPRKVSPLLKKVTLDVRNNLLATVDCPSNYVEERVFIDYPPEVYSWAVVNNQPILPKAYSPLCSGGTSTSVEKSYIAIVYPKNQAVFENAPLVVVNQALEFEVNVSSDVQSVTWVIDNKKRYTSNSFPFHYSWSLVTGSHTVQAIATTNSLKQLASTTVSFRVIDYKSGY